MDDATVLILAGGAASRFPGKLESLIGGEPLIARVYERLSCGRWPVTIAVNRDAVPGAVAALGAPLIFDETPGQGPLLALLSASRQLNSTRVFAIAADQPHLELTVLERLADAWEPGDEAAVPLHDGRVEPLAALYARDAVLREALRLRQRNERSMHALVSQLVTRLVPLGTRYFTNVNTPADLAEATRSR